MTPVPGIPEISGIPGISNMVRAGRQPFFRGRRGRGFTLIEVLAVIVIISMAGGLTIVSLSSVSDAAAFRAASARSRELDGKARLFARTGTPVKLSATTDHDGLVVQTVGTGEVLATTSMPSEVTVYLGMEDQQTRAVTFDRSGRSADYRIILGRAESFTVLKVSGLTGAMFKQEGGAS